MPRTVGTHDDEGGSSRPKRTRQHDTMEEMMLPCVHHEFLLWGYAEEIEEMLKIKVYEVGGQEEIFNKHSDELNDEEIEVYFQGGLCSDEKFNARDYWLSISSKENLHFSRSLASTIRSPVLMVLQKMITYGSFGYVNVAWLMEKWLKRKGVGSQRDNMICCGQFITRIAQRMGLLSDEVMNSLSALTYCRALDATTLRELIDSNGRLIAEDPSPRVPRVAMPRGPHLSMQDLYDQMGNMEIRQGTLERIAHI
ncbi:hypothetical protein Tco_0164226 [Tanacetum coccineum]